MSGKPRYNWNFIRQVYVSGDMNLVDLAKEKTGRESDPPYQSIRRAAATDSMGKWEDLRQAYRNTVATQISPLLTLELVLKLALSRKPTTAANQSTLS
jgi:hypothetical protein